MVRGQPGGRLRGLRFFLKRLPPSPGRVLGLWLIHPLEDRIKNVLDFAACREGADLDAHASPGHSA